MRSTWILAACVAATGCTEAALDDGAVDDGAMDDGAIDDGANAGGQPASEALSEEFDAAPTGWSTLNAAQAAIRFVDGTMVIEPQKSLWFNESTGPLYSRPVQGNFVVTADVRTRGLSDPSAPPRPTYRLGGLMARSPNTAGAENYVFIVLGADENDVAVETKSTVNSVSTFDGPPWPDGEGEIRICRVGPRLELLVRARGGAWQSQAVFDRGDLPATLQVGAVAYANAEDPDLRVTYDYIRFAEAASQAACTE